MPAGASQRASAGFVQRFALSVVLMRSHLVSGCVGPLQLDPEPGPVAIGAQRAAARVERPIEQETLDARVVMEVLEVRQALHRAAGMHRYGRRAVCGERLARRLAEAVDPQDVR